MQSCSRNNSIRNTTSRSNSVDNNQTQAELTAQRVISSDQTPHTALISRLSDRRPAVLGSKLRAAFGLSFSSREIKRHSNKFEPAYLIDLAARNPKQALKFIQRINNTLQHRNFDLSDPKVNLFFTILSAFRYRHRLGSADDRPRRNRPNLTALSAAEIPQFITHPEYGQRSCVVDDPYYFLLFDDSLKLKEKQRVNLLTQFKQALTPFTSREEILIREQQNKDNSDDQRYLNMNLSDTFFANGQHWYQPPGSNVVLTLAQGYQYLCNWKEGRIKPRDLDNEETLKVIRAFAPSNAALPNPVMEVQRDNHSEIRRILTKHRQNGFPSYIPDKFNHWYLLTKTPYNSLALSDKYPCSMAMLRCKLHMAGYKQELLLDTEITAFAAAKKINLVSEKRLRASFIDAMADIDQMDNYDLFSFAIYFNTPTLMPVIERVNASLSANLLESIETEKANLISGLKILAASRSGYQGIMSKMVSPAMPAPRSPEQLNATGFGLQRFDNKTALSESTASPASSSFVRQGSSHSIRAPRAPLPTLPINVLAAPAAQHISPTVRMRLGQYANTDSIDLTGLLPPPSPSNVIFMTRLELRDALHAHGVDASLRCLSTATLHQIARQHHIQLTPQSDADRQKLQDRQRQQARH